MTAAEEPHVVVVWRAAGDSTFHLLNSYHGVRVYRRNNVDPRCHAGKPAPPYFKSWVEALAYITDHPMESAQLDLKEALRVGVVTKRELW